MSPGLKRWTEFGILGDLPPKENQVKILHYSLNVIVRILNRISYMKLAGLYIYYTYENSLKFVLLEIYNIKFSSKEFNSNWAMMNI